MAWKNLYIYRTAVESMVSDLLEKILAGQTNRIARYESIARFGYDAKDVLLRNCNAADNAEDVLARRFDSAGCYIHDRLTILDRYYATSVLDHIQRTKALEEWSSMLKGRKVPLERALGAFDMFVLHDQPGDLDEVSLSPPHMAVVAC